MATYSSRDAIATASARAIEGLLPLIRAWHDTSRELWAYGSEMPPREVVERFTASYSEVLTYCQQYGIRAHHVLGA